MVMHHQIHLNSFMPAELILLRTAFWTRDKAGFVKKFKLKTGSVPIVRDPNAPSEEVSLILYIIYDYLQIAFALQRKRGAGWAEHISM